MSKMEIPCTPLSSSTLDDALAQFMSHSDSLTHIPHEIYQLDDDHSLINDKVFLCPHFGHDA